MFNSLHLDSKKQDEQASAKRNIYARRTQNLVGTEVRTYL